MRNEFCSAIIRGIGSNLAGGFQVVRYSFFFVEPQVLGVRPDKPLVEDTARKQFEMFFFQGAQQASSDLSGFGNVVEGHAAHFALPTKPFAK